MPKLVAVEGPARGAAYPLEKSEVSIGRSSANDIAIADLTLSRRHCTIRFEQDSYVLRDLESNNGAFVNDAAVTECTLAHGDRITVGETVFLFVVKEAEDAGASIDPKISVGETVQLSREEAFYLHPERFTESNTPTARLVRDLHSLLDIAHAISQTDSIEALTRQLLKLALEAVPAERGAILFVEQATGQISAAYGWDRRIAADSHVPVSSAVVGRVLTEGIAIFSNDARHTAAPGEAGALRAGGVKSVLAVPVMREDRLLGVIYLDSSDPRAGFDMGHLQLLSAISGMAALTIESVRRLEALAEENRCLQAGAALEHNMVGESPALRETLRLIGRVAPTDSTVLILGESGTGKELAARAIHQNSPRSQRAFVGINCAALTETLVESELFGHEKGAFTGAFAQKKGKLELADGGTLFLDEIGELAPALQVKLLRVLQEREFERVGGAHPVRVDVRLIAATNRDLSAAARNNAFRQDLFYRLNVVSLTMPPLRERREDIPLLAEYFIQKFSRKIGGRRVRGLSPGVRALLVNHHWPGNVRELENVIERALVLGTGDLITLEDLPETLLEVAPGTVPLGEYHAAINDARSQIILRALEKTKGNVTQAARLLGIQATYVHRLIRNLKIKPRLERSAGEGQ